MKTSTDNQIWGRTHVLPVTGNCDVTDFIRASYAVGSNPLPHLRKEFGGKWELAAATVTPGGGLRPLPTEAPEGALPYIVSMLGGYPRAAVNHWPLRHAVTVRSPGNVLGTLSGIESQIRSEIAKRNSTDEAGSTSVLSWHETEIQCRKAFYELTD